MINKIKQLFKSNYSYNKHIDLLENQVLQLKNELQWYLSGIRYLAKENDQLRKSLSQSYGIDWDEKKTSLVNKNEYH